MENTDKKLTANDAIVLMLQGINADKKDVFYKAAESYLGTLSKSGNWYHKIHRLLREKPMQFTRLENMSNDIKKLVTQKVIEDFNVFLPEDLQNLLSDLLVEWRNAEAFNYHNLGVRNKILLHGPTGNGKTTIGKHIARMVELPFVEVNSDVMIDSHLGSTGANIYKLFQNIQEACVLFWDEIDSIGCKRGMSRDSSGATMENDRMVNSILVNMEKMHPGVIFVGATNRLDILDPAFMRRFHEVVEVKAPTMEEKVRYIETLYEYYKIPFDSNNKTTMADLSSYSAIKTLFLSEARRYLAKNLTSYLQTQ